MVTPGAQFVAGGYLSGSSVTTTIGCTPSAAIWREIIDGSSGPEHHVFEIGTFSGAQSKTVKFQDLTIANGHSDTPQGGGGVYVDANGPKLEREYSRFVGRPASVAKYASFWNIVRPTGH